MGLVSGIVAKARNAAIARNIAKKLGGTRKVAQKVNIVSDDFTKTPGVLNLKTGTKTFNNFGGTGIRIVEPGANTTLGKLGVTKVTKYPTDYIGNTEPLLAFETKTMKETAERLGRIPDPMLLTPKEAKECLALGREIKAEADKGFVQKLLNF